MSYARFGEDSSVYVYLDCGGYLSCCGCILQESEWVDDPSQPIIGGYFKRVGEIVQDQFATTEELLAHLDRHRAAGHAVEDDTYESLRQDAAENNAWIENFASGAPDRSER